jgi:hypothetical protein
VEVPSVGAWLRFDESGPLLQPMMTMAAKSPKPIVKNKRLVLIFIILNWRLLISNADATGDFEIIHRLESKISLKKCLLSFC